MTFPYLGVLTLAVLVPCPGLGSGLKNVRRGGRSGSDASASPSMTSQSVAVSIEVRPRATWSLNPESGWPTRMPTPPRTAGAIRSRACGTFIVRSAQSPGADAGSAAQSPPPNAPTPLSPGA